VLVQVPPANAPCKCAASGVFGGGACGENDKTSMAGNGGGCSERRALLVVSSGR
jgi:hypothetical protein